MIEVEPRSSDVSAVASLNAWLPRLESVLGRFIDVRPALLKALGPIVVTPVPERSTTARLAVSLKARAPTLCKLAGKVIVVKLHPLKAPVPMVVVPLGILTCPLASGTMEHAADDCARLSGRFDITPAIIHIIERMSLAGGRNMLAALIP